MGARMAEYSAGESYREDDGNVLAVVMPELIGGESVRKMLTRCICAGAGYRYWAHGVGADSRIPLGGVRRAMLTCCVRAGVYGPRTFSPRWGAVATRKGEIRLKSRGRRLRKVRSTPRICRRHAQR